jgi:hypothetical protein
VHAWVRSVLRPCYELQVQRGGDWVPLLPPRDVEARPFDPAGRVNHRAAWEEAVTATEADRTRVRLVAVYSDRLACHMFQYAQARLRAAFLDVAFAAPRLGGPFGTTATDVQRYAPPGERGGDAAAGVTRHPLLLRARGDGGSRDSGRTPPVSPAWVRLARAWLHTPSCQYVLDMRMLAGSEGEVTSWLAPGVGAATAKLLAAGSGGASDGAHHAGWGPSDVAVHVRAGDILWGHHAAYRPLPLSFYRDALHIAAARLAAGAAADDARGDRGTPARPPRHRSVSRRRAPSAGGGSGGGGRASAAADHSAATAAAPAAASATHLCGHCGRHHGRLGRVVIVTEDAQNALVQRTAAALRTLAAFGGGTVDAAGAAPLVAGGVTVRSGSLSDDIATLVTAPALVLSVSGFAWWAGQLSTHAHTVVAPRWGLLTTQDWQPSPAAHPALVMRHDLTLLRTGPAWVAPGEDEAAALARLQAALAAALPAPPGSVGDGASWALTGDFRPLPQASRVVDVPLPHLPAWPGNRPHAVEALFDV